MVLGVLFKHTPAESATRISSAEAIDAGLLQGSVLFGITLILTAVWLIRSDSRWTMSSPSTSWLAKSKEAKRQRDKTLKTD